jgi:hypothetical protein
MPSTASLIDTWLTFVGSAQSMTGFCSLCRFSALLDRAHRANTQWVNNPQQFVFGGTPTISPQTIYSGLKCCVTHLISKFIYVFLAIMRTYMHGRQEDAHEFLRFFLESMQNARLLPYRKVPLCIFSKETNIISRIFGGFWLNCGKFLCEFEKS